jgi:hypothetical protein
MEAILTAAQEHLPSRETWRSCIETDGQAADEAFGLLCRHALVLMEQHITAAAIMAHYLCAEEDEDGRTLPLNSETVVRMFMTTLMEAMRAVGLPATLVPVTAVPSPPARES